MSTLSTKAQLNLSALFTTPLDLADATANLTKSYIGQLVTGVGAGQADRVFHDKRPLGPSATDDLDLAGALLDPLGGPFVLARVKALFVRADDANLNDILVGGAAANPWSTLLGTTGQVRLRPGAFFLAHVGSAVGGSGDAIGYTVTPATGDLLRVTNAAGVNTVNYDIVVIGCSA